MKKTKRYMYVAGMSTGIIMSFLSILAAVQMLDYMESGGSAFVLILVAMVIGLAIGGAIAFLVNQIS